MKKELVLMCQNVNKFIGKKQILKDINLELYQGEILAFIGPNGAGKTTLIKLILGLQSITSGNIYINSFNVKKDFVKAIKDVGAIVEAPDMYMYLSGYKNLKLVSSLYPNVSKERIDEVVKLVGLTSRIHDKVNKYSLGMRQRLGIAQALLHQPNLLILDEPTNGLDPEGIIQLRKLLIKLAKKKNMAILISSHQLLELESFCNKVCIIRKGKIIDCGLISDIKEDDLTTYIFKLNKTDKIENIIFDITIIDNETISIKTDKNNISKIIKKLLDNNFLIYEVYQKNITLEQAFLNKVGGNTID
ncbi:MAG: ABC transporter ATP-binding protein [bacterium]|nr:ABC transporter ATP-binding protein [bacterium]